jgi:hypothetical protein
MTTTLRYQGPRRASPPGPRPRPHHRATDTNAECFYDYAGDDPTNNVDPSGMCVVGTRWIKHAVHT